MTTATAAPRPAQRSGTLEALVDGVRRGSCESADIYGMPGLGVWR